MTLNSASGVKLDLITLGLKSRLVIQKSMFYIYVACTGTKLRIFYEGEGHNNSIKLMLS